MNLYIANVGVNTKHAFERGIKSPIFPNGTFEFIPILEEEDSKYTSDTYSTLECYNNSELTLSHYIDKEEYHNCAVHNDPEFKKCTYGDLIKSPRASNLSKIEKNDILLFLARLYKYVEGKFTDKKGDLYFIGCFTIAENREFDNWQINRQSEGCDKWRKNAHFKKFERGKMEAFRILRGVLGKSCRFKRALLVDIKVQELIYDGEYDGNRFISKKDGYPVKTNKGQELEISTFSSKTRSIQSYWGSKDQTENDCMRELLTIIKERCF
jgi:hypothetical protein